MAKQPQGHFLGVPYNWSRPSREELKRGVWDPDDSRVLRPRPFGWGYAVNMHALMNRVRGR